MTDEEARQLVEDLDSMFSYHDHDHGTEQHVRRKRITHILDLLLEKRRESLDTGWALVTREDLILLRMLIKAIVWAKWGADVDGDRPIQAMVIDRSKTHGLHYEPIPYGVRGRPDTAQEIWDNQMHAALLNLQLATRDFQLYGDHFDHAMRLEKEERAQKA